MEKLRIKLLCTFEAHTAGGILMNGRANGLAELGHDVELVYHPAKYSTFQKTDSVKKGLYTIYSKYPKFVKKSKLLWPFFVPAYMAFTVVPLLMKLRTSDMVIVHKPLPMSTFFIGLLRLVRYPGKICLIQSDWEGIGGFVDVYYFDNIARKLLVSFCEAWAPYKSDILFCASKLIITRMSLSSVLKDRVIYLPCGGDVIEYSLPEAGAHKIQVLYVGTFKSSILIKFLIQIVQQVVNRCTHIEFVFIGGGPLYSHLEQAVEDAHLSEWIILKNQISREEVLSYLKSVHIALLPLNPYYPETYIEASRSSTKLFEYMAAGKIIIATDFAEPQEILKDGETGFLVSHDSQSFADKIIEAIECKDEWALISKGVRKEFIDHYSHAVLMKKLIDYSFKPLK